MPSPLDAFIPRLTPPQMPTSSQHFPPLTDSMLRGLGIGGGNVGPRHHNPSRCATTCATGALRQTPPPLRQRVVTLGARDSLSSGLRPNLSYPLIPSGLGGRGVGGKSAPPFLTGQPAPENFSEVGNIELESRLE